MGSAKRGILGAVGHCEEFDPVLVDPLLQRKGAVSFAPDGSQSTRVPTTLHSCEPGGLHRSSVVVMVTNTSTSLRRDLALVNVVIAHAARRAESEDIVVAVFDVRRAYFYAEEKRDTFVELPDYTAAGFRTTHVGKLCKALYGTRPAAASWRDELRKVLVSCNLSVGTVSRCCFHNKLRSVTGTVHGDDIFVAGPRQEKSKMGGRDSRSDDRIQAWRSEGTPHSQSYAALVQGWVGICSKLEAWQGGC